MRTIVYVDGFNLYYGACRARGRKWLDLSALASRLLPNDEIVEIAYCTANIKKDHSDPDKQDRQRLYHRALQTIPHLEIYRGRYLPKIVSGPLVDPADGERPIRFVETYEEKGTDVNIASLLLTDGYDKRYESAVVISNDGSQDANRDRPKSAESPGYRDQSCAQAARKEAECRPIARAIASECRVHSTQGQACGGMPIPRRIDFSKGGGANQACSLVGRLERSQFACILLLTPPLFRRRGARPPVGGLCISRRQPVAVKATCRRQTLTTLQAVLAPSRA